MYIFYPDVHFDILYFSNRTNSVQRQTKCLTYLKAQTQSVQRMLNRNGQRTITTSRPVNSMLKPIRYSSVPVTHFTWFYCLKTCHNYNCLLEVKKTTTMDCSKSRNISKYIYTLGHKLGTTSFSL